MLPLIAPLIATGIATGVGLGAQGIAAGIEGQRPENRMTAAEWLRHRGLEEAKRAGEVGAYQAAGTAKRGAIKDIGAKTQYRLGPGGVGAVAGSMMPTFRRALRGGLASAAQRQGALEGAAMEERAGLEAASKQRRAILAQIMALGGKAAGSFAEKGLEGTDLEGMPLGFMSGGAVGGIGALGMAGDLSQRRRRDDPDRTSRPLFGGGSNYGLYGYGGLYG